MPLKIDMDKSPKAQLEALRNRQKLITTSKWNELEKEAHDKAFTVAKVMSADVLQDIYDYVQTAVKEGLSYKSFKDRVRNGGLVERMQNAGWLKTATDKQIGARLQVIIDTNVKMAYGKGNYNRLMLVKDKKPYWIYHQVERKTKRAEHSIYNGRKFHCDDPIWNTIYPPSGFRCSCWVEAVAEPDGIESGSNIEINPDEHPISPLSVWKPETSKYVEGIGKALEGTLRMKDVIKDTAWVQELLDAEQDWDKWYNLECDLLDKPHFSSIDDAILFSKKNINHNKDCKQPLKGQTTWQDYGLKTHQNVNNASKTTRAIRSINSMRAEANAAIFYYIITNTAYEDITIKTPIQNIKITKNLVIHTLYNKDKTLKDLNRTQYAHCLIPSLTDPDEIWETAYPNDDGSIKRKLRYFKVFKIRNSEEGFKSVMVATSFGEEPNEYISTIIPRRGNASNDWRVGRLLYASPNIISSTKKYKRAMLKYSKIKV